MAIEIPLSKTGKHAGKYVAIVDDIDADLAELNWHVHFSGQQVYARIKTAKQDMYLHRVILERILNRTLGNNELADHRDVKGLNCCRLNLRLATFSQNRMNTLKRTDSKNPYKGISHRKNRWVTRIDVDNKIVRLGSFSTPEEAFYAYCIGAIIHHREFANFGDSPLTGIPRQFVEFRDIATNHPNPHIREVAERRLHKLIKQVIEGDMFALDSESAA
jgi:hypothetical protein